jgi:nucleotide-binding universal stress UspA family protein
MKTLLVPLAGTQAERSLSTALPVAQLFDGHIECCYVRPSTLQLAVRAMPHGEDRKAAGEALASRWEEMKAEENADASKAHHAFSEFCRRNGVEIENSPSGMERVSAGWLEMTGDCLQSIVGRAWFNDIVVLTRMDYDKHPSTEIVGEVLLHVGRPVLIASQETKKDPVDSVVVAWKPTPASVQAVSVAAPLLAKAQRVTILAAVESGFDQASAKASCSELAAQLAWSGIKAEPLVLENDEEPVRRVLSAAAAYNGSLLVMGGYGHSRMREFVLGGFTRAILHDAPLPVLMAH